MFILYVCARLGIPTAVRKARGPHLRLCLHCRLCKYLNQTLFFFRDMLCAVKSYYRFDARCTNVCNALFAHIGHTHAQSLASNTIFTCSIYLFFLYRGLCCCKLCVTLCHLILWGFTQSRGLTCVRYQMRIYWISKTNMVISISSISRSWFTKVKKKHGWRFVEIASSELAKKKKWHIILECYMLYQQRGGVVVHSTYFWEPFHVEGTLEAFSDITSLPRVVACVWHLGYNLENLTPLGIIDEYTAVTCKIGHFQKCIYRYASLNP
jgi:hypothetical protein